jgi:hypothetical protein
MQTPSVNLYAQKFLQPYVSKDHFATEVVEQSELVSLGGRLKHNHSEAELVNESVRKSKVELSGFIEETNATRALSSLDHELSRSGIEPSLSLLDQLTHYVAGERTRMFFPQFELDL